MDPFRVNIRARASSSHSSLETPSYILTPAIPYMTSNGSMLGGGDQHLCITKHAHFTTLHCLLDRITNYYYYYNLLCRVVRDTAYILLPRPTENRLVETVGFSLGQRAKEGCVAFVLAVRKIYLYQHQGRPILYTGAQI